MYSCALLVVAALQLPDSLSLEEALARALAARPQVVAASGAVLRARGAARVGSIIPNPTVQVEFDDLSPTHKLTATQPLGWLVRHAAEREAGRSGVARALADSVQTVADLGLGVRRAFYGALAADALLHLIAEQGAIADSLARLAEARLRSGDISALERDQVVQEAARVRLSMSQSREASRAGRVGLGRAVAWGGGASPAPAGPLDAGLDDVRTSAAPPTPDVSTLPLVRSAVADSSAAAARLRAARLARLPVPGIVAGREWGKTEGDDNVILGFALPVPFWSQGNEAVAEARGAAIERAALATEARLELSARLEEAEIRLAESAGRARFARDSLLVAARELRAGTVRLYESGRTGVLPVFDALRAERDVAQALVRELLAFQEARASLIALLGRWD